MLLQRFPCGANPFRCGTCRRGLSALMSLRGRFDLRLRFSHRRTDPVQGAKKGFGSASSSGTLKADIDNPPASKPPPASQPPSASSPTPAAPPRPVVASTPQAVVDRMFIRMVTCAALPIVFGLCLLVFFYYKKTSTDEDFPMWIVYLSQNLTFGGGLLGITYGIVSTCWDPNREGSFLGWDEFRVNLPVLLNRNKSS